MPCPLSACLRYWPGWPWPFPGSKLAQDDPWLSHSQASPDPPSLTQKASSAACQSWEGAQEREALREHGSVTGFSCILLADLMWTLLDLWDADVTRSCGCWGLSESYPEQRRRHHLLGLCSKAMKEKRPPCSVLPLECAWQHFYVSRRGGNAFTFLTRNADPGFPRYLRKRSLGS